MRALIPKNGFSLMEVMVALALLALSFTSLVLVQSRATSLAVKARSISIATQLARYQLMECKRDAQKIIASASDFKLEGDFLEAGFEKFTWECHAPRFNMRTPSASALESQAKAKAPEGTKDSFGATSSAMSPMMSLITDSLGNSVRELVVIIRWSDNSIEDEIRVVTHIVDLAAMSALSKMLNQGASSLSKPAAKPDQPQPPPEGGGPPPGPRPPGQPFRPGGPANGP